MKILLVGEYSNVHNTLAQGLKALGHDVTVASNGDFWKNYPRDIDLKRDEGIKGKVSFLWRLMRALPKMRGYDIVQLINPMFLEIKAEHLFGIYKYLRRNNKKVVLGAFGMDYYWVKVNSEEMPLRYSDFNIGKDLRHDEAAEKERADWVGTAKQHLNEIIANDCDGIVSGLYEYWVTYQQFKNKMVFIPFPIVLPSENTAIIDKTNKESDILDTEVSNKIRIFIGISKGRSVYKGTDVMLKAAENLKKKYPEHVELKVAEGVPFCEYQHMMNSSDILLDQLYAYTPAMNALLAMSKGIIVAGGGEEENYDILGEKELRPIINVGPDYESCYHGLENIILHPERIPELKQQSIEYIKRYHEHVIVAQKYIDFYNSL